MKFKNWDKYQSFRKDRPGHAWKKLHISALTDYDLNQLAEFEQARFFKLILVADPKTGELPNRIEELAYAINIPDGAEPLDMTRFSKFIDGTGQPLVDQRSTSGQPTVDQRYTSGQPAVNPEKRRVEIEKSINHIVRNGKSGKKAVKAKESSTFDREETFQAFWKIYPVKVKKAPARKAYMSKVKTEDIAASVLAGVARWELSKQWTKDNGEYIPHASTWLNAEQWNDEPDVQKDISAKFTKMKGLGL